MTGGCTGLSSASVVRAAAAASACPGVNTVSAHGLIADISFVLVSVFVCLFLVSRLLIGGIMMMIYMLFILILVYMVKNSISKAVPV